MDHLLDDLPALTRPRWSTWLPAPRAVPGALVVRVVASAGGPAGGRRRRGPPPLPPPLPTAKPRPAGTRHPRVASRSSALERRGSQSASIRLQDLRALARRSQASLPSPPDLPSDLPGLAIAPAAAPAAPSAGPALDLDPVRAEPPGAEIPRASLGVPMRAREDGRGLGIGSRRRGWTLFLGASLAVAALFGHLTSTPSAENAAENPVEDAVEEFAAPAIPATRAPALDPAGAGSPPENAPAAPAAPPAPQAPTGTSSLRSPEPALGASARAADEPAGVRRAGARPDRPAASSTPAPAKSAAGKPRRARRPATAPIPAAGSAEQATPSLAPRASSGLVDAAAGMRHIDEIAASFGACRAPGDPAGRGLVAVTFLPSGQVGAVAIEAGPFAGTAVGACLARAFGAARLPPFEGSPIVVRRAFVVR